MLEDDYDSLGIVCITTCQFTVHCGPFNPQNYEEEGLGLN